MLLKRIASRLPAHLAELIPVLEQANVRTTDALLLTPLPTLLARLPLPSSSTSDLEQSLENLRAYALQLTAPRSCAGDVALRELEGRQRDGAEWVGFGLKGLDEVVLPPGADEDGGGIVLEISGGRRVGKSLLVLHSALLLLVNDPKAKVRWLDTEGAFSSNRAKAVLESWGIEDPSAVLDRLVVGPCYGVDPGLYDALGEIEKEWLEGNNDSAISAKTKMLVVDPITNMFKDLLLGTSSQGHATMVTVMEDIASLTYTYGLVTIFTNTTSSAAPSNPLSTFSTTTVKPSLGAAFVFAADTTVLVQETGRVFGMVDEEERERTRRAPGLRGVVEVLKSRVGATGGWAVFETDGIRLHDVVPPPDEDERTLRMSRGDLQTDRPVFGALRETMIP